MEEAAQAAGVKESLIQVIMKRYPSLKKSPYVHEIICLYRQKLLQAGITLRSVQEVKRLLKIGSDGISEDGRVLYENKGMPETMQDST